VNVFDAGRPPTTWCGPRLARHGLYSTPPNPASVRAGPLGPGRGQGFHQRAGRSRTPRSLRCTRPGSRPVARRPTSRSSRARITGARRPRGCADRRGRAAAWWSRCATRNRGWTARASAGSRRPASRPRTACSRGEAAEDQPGFVKRMVTGRPWVTSSSGASLDGRTALADGTSKWITGERARADVQRLRHARPPRHGSGTVLADDPDAHRADPDLDLRGRRPLAWCSIPRSTRHDRAGAELCRSTLILTRNAASALRSLCARPEARVSGASVARGTRPRRRTRAARRARVQRGPGRGRPTLAAISLRRGLVDEIVVYMAPVVARRLARGLFNLPPLARMCDRCEFEWRDVAAHR